MYICILNFIAIRCLFVEIQQTRVLKQCYYVDIIIIIIIIIPVYLYALSAACKENISPSCMYGSI